MKVINIIIIVQLKTLPNSFDIQESFMFNVHVIILMIIFIYTVDNITGRMVDQLEM